MLLKSGRVAWRQEHLVVDLLSQDAALPEDQVQGSAQHQQAVTHVAKHHGEQERKGDDGVWSCKGTRGRGSIFNLRVWIGLSLLGRIKVTWVDFSVVPDAVGVNDVLEA